MISESCGTSSASVSATRSSSESLLCSESTSWKTSASRRNDWTSLERSPRIGSGSGKTAGVAIYDVRIGIGRCGLKLPDPHLSPSLRSPIRRSPEESPEEIPLRRHHELARRALAEQLAGEAADDRRRDAV